MTQQQRRQDITILVCPGFKRTFLRGLQREEGETIVAAVGQVHYADDGIRIPDSHARTMLHRGDVQLCARPRGITIPQSYKPRVLVNGEARKFMEDNPLFDGWSATYDLVASHRRTIN